MTWTPEKNIIILDLLTEEQKKALRAAKHRWKCWSTSKKEWVDNENPVWAGGSVYRANPAPKRIVVWLYVSEKGNPYSARIETTALNYLRDYGGILKRIEMDEDGSNVVVTDEVFTDAKEVL